MKKQYLVIGLGNPGKEFDFTYHNIGREIVKKLASKYKKDWHFSPDLEAYLTRVKLSKKEVILALPETGMNLSGRAVKKIIDHFKIWPKDLVVVHDDHDILWGKVKIVKNRGSAGHKGVLSIIDHLKTKNFIRLRIGIRQNPEEKAAQIVLAKLPSSAKTEAVLSEGVTIIEKLFEKGLSWVMSEYNSNKKNLWEKKESQRAEG